MSHKLQREIEDLRREIARIRRGISCEEKRDIIKDVLWELGVKKLDNVYEPVPLWGRCNGPMRDLIERMDALAAYFDLRFDENKPVYRWVKKSSPGEKR